jgi:hypothetical protein
LSKKNVVDRSSLQGESFEIFKAAIKSPVTRDVYERRLLNFLAHFKMTPEEFLTMAKNNPVTTTEKMISSTIPKQIRRKRICHNLKSIHIDLSILSILENYHITNHLP